MGGTHIVVSLNPSNFPMSAVAERSHWFLLLESTYRQLIQTLQTNGFFRCQYSDYDNPFVPAWFAWATMFALVNIQPPGKMESTVGGLKLHFFHLPAIQDVTADVQLGGVHATILRGPTPRNLVTPVAAALAVPPAIPALPPALPRYSHPSIGAGIPANWRI